MHFTVEADCWEDYLPSPRHRVMRQRRITRDYDAEIREATGNEAPLAITQRGWGPDGFTKSFAGGQRVEYRWYEGRLWTRPRLNRFYAHPEVNRYATVQDVIRYSTSYRYDASLDEAGRQDAVDCHFTRFLLIDGRLHESIGEPRYVVMTFGLGHNHGGTALLTDNVFNPNLHRNRYHRIDQLSQAVEDATRIAEARGDTNDLPIRPSARFTIHVPDAIRLDPARHGTGDPFLNRLYDLSESGAPPAFVGLAGIREALRGDPDD